MMSFRGLWPALCVAAGLTLTGCRDDAGGPGGGEDDGAEGDGGSDGADDDADGSGDDGDEAGEDRAEPVYLTPTEHLVRISMALRGTRPSKDQLEAVANDPDALEGIVDEYLDSPNFGETIRDLHNDTLLLLLDFLVFPAGFTPKGELADLGGYELNREITEAPLRLIEHIVMNDRPYTEIVTADYTLANDVTSVVWGLPYDGSGEWQETAWDDGRGNAGILSDSWLYQRHSSTLSNANRGRANAISRALLCYDFLSRDIEVDSSVNLADPDQVANAVIDNPSCASCHQGLDPLASFFRSYYPLYVPAEMDYPISSYSPELFPEQLGVPMRDPAYFGLSGDETPSLGEFIAEDPRFAQCTATKFYAYFQQIDIDAVPLETAAELQATLVDSGFDAKALTKAIMLSDDFRISHYEDEPEEDDPRAQLAIKKLRPVQLAQLARSTTGFDWITDLGDPSIGPVDLLRDSFLGYQTLGGGIDSMYVTRPAHTYSATSSLVLSNLAREAAHFVVESDFAADSGDKRLLTMVSPGDTGEVEVRDQIAVLYLKLFGEIVEPESADVDETYDLFESALAVSNDTARAWKTTIAAMLQDVRVAYY